MHSRHWLTCVTWPQKSEPGSLKVRLRGIDPSTGGANNRTCAADSDLFHLEDSGPGGSVMDAALGLRRGGFGPGGRRMEESGKTSRCLRWWPVILLPCPLITKSTIGRFRFPKFSPRKVINVRRAKGHEEDMVMAPPAGHCHINQVKQILHARNKLLQQKNERTFTSSSSLFLYVLSLFKWKSVFDHGTWSKTKIKFTSTSVLLMTSNKPGHVSSVLFFFLFFSISIHALIMRLWSKLWKLHSRTDRVDRWSMRRWTTRPKKKKKKQSKGLHVTATEKQNKLKRKVVRNRATRRHPATAI